MCLGNSITQGDTSYDSYRRHFTKLLDSSSISYDMVGSMDSNYLGLPPNTDFDNDHEGHWGWRVDEILYGRPGQGKLGIWAQQENPDFVLIHLGSNDLYQGESVLSTLNEIEQLIDTLRSKNSSVIVLLAQIIPSCFDSTWNAQIDSFNSQIPGLALSKMAVGSPILVVDQNSGFNPNIGADTHDKVHPNSSGEYKMAKKWHSSFMLFYAALSTEAITLESVSRVKDGFDLSWSVQGEFLNEFTLRCIKANGETISHSSHFVRNEGVFHSSILEQTEEACSFYVVGINKEGVELVSNRFGLGALTIKELELRQIGEMLYLDIQSTEEARLQFSLYSIDGKLMLEKTKQLAEGSNSFQFNKPAQSGVYFLNVRFGGEAHSFKFLL